MQAEGTALFDTAGRRKVPTDPQQRTYLGFGFLLAGRHDHARRILIDVVDQARALGTVDLLPYALIRLADVELETGRWATAAALLDEASRLARETGQVGDYGLSLGALAWLEAARGHGEDCRVHVDEAIELAGRLGTGARLDRAATALGLLELGLGNPRLAIDHLEDSRHRQPRCRDRFPATARHATQQFLDLVNAGCVLLSDPG